MNKTIADGILMGMEKVGFKTLDIKENKIYVESKDNETQRYRAKTTSDLFKSYNPNSKLLVKWII